MLTRPSAMPDASVGLRCMSVAARPCNPLSCPGDSLRMAAAAPGVVETARVCPTVESASMTPAAMQERLEHALDRGR